MMYSLSCGHKPPKIVEIVSIRLPGVEIICKITAAAKLSSKAVHANRHM